MICGGLFERACPGRKCDSGLEYHYTGRCHPTEKANGPGFPGGVQFDNWA